MKKKSIILISVLILLVLVAVALMTYSRKPLLKQTEKSWSLFKTRSSSGPLVQTAGPETILQPKSQEMMLSAEFLTWFSSELKNVERPVEDPEVLENRLIEKLASLSSDEKQYFLVQLLDPDSPASSKILSSYLLGLGHNSTAPILENYLSAPLVYPEGPTHSPEETLHMQEKSFRRSAIDSLIKIAQQDLTYRAKLQAEFLKIPQADLREYALKKLAETR